ncbi:hypothetical protein L1987_26746 [Smallanthus sonchifolius]|uniref:Uncharacterized protein n=1 Tax=Smallanthus sonchifolius TaxID=185202 RepID=A0ACB9IBN2_9ASTR|nr:hypothetical protein L1987_26746 [Smallanthus sonchifolius]
MLDSSELSFQSSFMWKLFQWFLHYVFWLIFLYLFSDLFEGIVVRPNSGGCLESSPKYFDQQSYIEIGIKMQDIVGYNF